MVLQTMGDVAQQTLIEHGLLGNLLIGLRSTLAWEVQDDDFSRKLSTLRFMAQCFQRHLERMMAMEEYDGYMDLVGTTCPWLGRKVDALRSEHATLREKVRRAVQRLERASPTDQADFAGICDDFTDLLQRVKAHTRKEVALVQEAFAQDSGGEG